MVKISDRMLQVEESPTLGTSNKVKELKAQGMDIISLTVGELRHASPPVSGAPSRDEPP